MFAKRAFLWLALLAVTTFSIWGVSPRLEAQSELDEVLPERLEMLVYPPTEENSAELAAVLAQMAPPDTAATSAPPNFHLPATLLVYQNFDTGNWEVLLNTAVQAKINLSNHPAADIHPRLNRGATHVLFASNRAGNFDLYVMKVDGSNLTQLTASAGDDVNPVWSPDGSKIAFESYRDGQPEIYVMNADGSNQTRLTASPDFDGMPTWSPDGQTIAFSSRRTGGYRIYTMDATTGANQIQRSTYPYSLSPAWSPEGNAVYFSADFNNDLWLDAVYISSPYFHPSTQVLIPVNHGAYTDIWIRDWSPEGRHVTYDVRRYDSNFHLTGLEIWIHNIDFYSQYPYVASQPFNVTDFLSINPAIHSNDILKPLTVIDNIPTYTSRNHPFLLKWDFLEEGSGVKNSTIWYQVDTAPWEALANFPPNVTTLRTDYFLDVIQSGETLSFRGYGIDNHGNEGWGQTASTTLYEWYFAGQFRDNRGRPIANTPLEFQTTTLNHVKTNESGQYFAYAIGNHAYNLYFNAHEQPLITPTQLSITQRNRLPVAYAWGLDNVVQNSGFETSWNHWIHSEGIVTPKSGYSGQGSFALGEPIENCINCIKTLTTFDWVDDFYGSWLSDQILDKLGNLHLFFNVQRTPNALPQIYHTVLQSDGQWTSLDATPIPSMYPKIFAAKDGGLDIFYFIDDTTLQFLRYQPNGQWSQPETISTNQYPVTIQSYHVDSQGIVHLFLYNYGTIYYKRATNGVWSVGQFPDNDAVSHVISLPNGELHLFQAESTPILNGIVKEVIHFVYQQNGVWQKIEQIFLDDVFADQTIELIYVEEEETLYIRTSHNMWRYRPHEDWVKLSTRLQNPSVRAILHGDGDYKVKLLIRDPYHTNWEEIWSEVLDDSPWAFLDMNNNVHYLTYDKRYYGTHGHTALHDQAHTLAQVITIPADMPNPTVSLMYRTVRDLPGDDTQFEVWLTNGTVTTTHVLSPTAIVWEHAWFDASEWAGETVTLTLAAVQRAGDPLLRVDLDDVSLGSAAPDTWVTVAAPNAAMPSEGVNLTLSYGNLSPDLLAHTTTLTLTLPAGLVVNSISVTPTLQTAEHIIWELGDLPANTSGAITLTATVNGNVPLWNTIMATAELRTPLAEPSWGNNEHTAALFIGRRAYLPAIFK